VTSKCPGVGTVSNYYLKFRLTNRAAPGRILASMTTPKSKFKFSPNLPASFVGDAADPESEISQFVDEFFIEYIIDKVGDEKYAQVLDEWDQIDDEAEQEQFLNEIEPDFLSKFHAALTKELMGVFNSD